MARSSFLLEIAELARDKPQQIIQEATEIKGETRVI